MELDILLLQGHTSQQHEVACIISFGSRQSVNESALVLLQQLHAVKLSQHVQTLHAGSYFTVTADAAGHMHAADKDRCCDIIS